MHWVYVSHFSVVFLQNHSDGVFLNETMKGHLLFLTHLYTHILSAEEELRLHIIKYITANFVIFKQCNSQGYPCMCPKLRHNTAKVILCLISWTKVHK